MNFIDRAVKNIIRKPTKTILLVITFFMIGNFVIVGQSVTKAAESAKTLTRKKMRAVVTMTIDYEQVNKYLESLEDEEERNKFIANYPSVKVQNVAKLLKDERVKVANAVSFDMCWQPEDSAFDYKHLNNDAESNMNSAADNSDSEDVYIDPKFVVKSNYFPDMIEFHDGKYKIVEGRMYTDEEIEKGETVALITEELAEINRLKVGDNFSLMVRQPNGSEAKEIGYTNEDATINFKVIGIYSHDDKITPGSENFDNIYPSNNPDNVILVPGNTIGIQTLDLQKKVMDYYKNQYPEDEYYQNPDNYPTEESVKVKNLGDVTLLLNDPLEVDKFVEEYGSVMEQFIKLDANNTEFKRMSKPLDALSLYANFLVWLVVIDAILIISLVTSLTLKNREYEIGVLLSIGVSKAKVIAQFFVELCIIGVIGFTLAIGSGSLAANKIGKIMLDYQISDTNKNESSDDIFIDNSIWNTDYTTKVKLDDFIKEYDVSVSPFIIAEIYGLGFMIIFVSVLVPSFMIMRYNPKRILMRAN